jgi:hypothetical protein
MMTSLFFVNFFFANRAGDVERMRRKDFSRPPVTDRDPGAAVCFRDFDNPGDKLAHPEF